MNNVQKLSLKLKKTNERFDLTAQDLEVLAYITILWSKHATVRVMDIVYGYLETSATTTLKSIRALTAADVITVTANDNDKRERIISMGKKFAALDKVFEGV